MPQYQHKAPLLLLPSALTAAHADVVSDFNLRDFGPDLNRHAAELVPRAVGVLGLEQVAQVALHKVQVPARVAVGHMPATFRRKFRRPKERIRFALRAAMPQPRWDSSN